EFYGELGLSGELKPIRGVLLVAAHAARDRHSVIVPTANLREARLAAPASTRHAPTLLAVCGMFTAEAGRATAGESQGTDDAPGGAARRRLPTLDIADVRGQAAPKRAMLVAAAGGHSILMIGPPGTGKSMLAQRLPGLLPPLADEEALDVAGIASV